MRGLAPLLLLAAAAPAAAQQMQGAFSPSPSAAEGQHSGGLHSTFSPLRPTPAAFRLPAPAPYSLAPLSPAESAPVLRPGALQTGVQRLVPAAALAAGQWLPSRTVWRLAVASPGASALRLHFSRVSLGAGALWVYSGSSIAGPFTGLGPLANGDFWTPRIPGSTAIVEFDASSPVSQLPFSLDSVAHQWLTPPPIAPDAASPNSAASCELDVSCYPSEASFAAGVILYDFVSSGVEYACSGALLASRSQSFTPYVLTAHHCVSSNADAASLQAFFFYQSASCNGPPPDINSVPSVTGATYLAGAPISGGDFAFLRLSASAPAGAYFFGWSTTLPNVGAPVTGIHHPEASWTRIAFGERAPDQDVSVSGETAPAALYLQASFTQGLIEPGSSGSPLLNSAGQIVGSLTGGPLPPAGGLCSLNPYPATYGRFSNAFPAIEPYLDAPAPASLAATPTALSFNSAPAATPPAQTLTIASPSASAGFTVSSSASWLILSASSGTAAPGSPFALQVSVNPSALSQPGLYAASISISGASVAPLAIPVSLNAAAPAAQPRVSVSVTPNPVPEASFSAAPPTWSFDITLTETAGRAAALTSLTVLGQDQSSRIASLFGSSTIPALGSLTARLTLTGIQPPQSGLVSASGADAASGAPWSAAAPLTLLGPPQSAGLSLSSVPAVIDRNAANSACPWLQTLVLRETGGVPVTLTRFAAGGTDLSSQLASFFGTSALPAYGALTATLCWAHISPPASFNAGVSGRDAFGNVVSASTAASFESPAASPAPLAVSPAAIDLQPGASASVSVQTGAAALPWTASLLFALPPASWLAISPSAGAGPATLTLTASAQGLAPGLYQATLLVSSPAGQPQSTAVPIRLRVPGAAVNSASYSPGAAPGSLLSVFGSSLASTSLPAYALPLPTELAGASATVGGLPAPLLFAGPGQLDLQVPFAVPPGPATLTINPSSGPPFSLPIYVSPAAPGIFTASDGRTLAPPQTVRPGAAATLFFTGQGVVSPALAAGQSPASSTPLAALPRPLASLSVTIAGQPAAIDFAALPPGLAGITQVNFTIPAGTPPGPQPVVVLVNGVPSNTATVTIAP